MALVGLGVQFCDMRLVRYGSLFQNRPNRAPVRGVPACNPYPNIAEFKNCWSVNSSIHVGSTMVSAANTIDRHKFAKTKLAFLLMLLCLFTFVLFIVVGNSSSNISSQTMNNSIKGSVTDVPASEQKK